MPEKQTYQTLRLILGDQLHQQHSWFQETDPEVLYVLMEIRPESEYVTHHIQKIVGIFQAMRAFAAHLREQGHAVHYFSILDDSNRHSFSKNCRFLIEQYGIQRLQYQEPDEYRLDQQLAQELGELGIPVEQVSSQHFFTHRLELKELFTGKKQYLMETFYRHMRKKHQVLMEDEDQPVTGTWNYDQENRKKLPKQHLPPAPITFSHDVADILNEVQTAKLPYIGEINPQQFIWPQNRQEALEVLDYFLKELYVNFGRYQDALSEEHWSIYHSRLSFALNIKLISPQEVVEAAETHWRAHSDEISIAQAEGFIRQVLGWREYMRGIYWAHMPDYAQENFFEAARKLPEYFWTGDTRMQCVKRAVTQSLDYGYAHHIQRLMVTGNFCALAGIAPEEVDQWYLGIYVDAFQWVEITNTRGMSQFADGGLVGTKPYVSSASYLHKMGDHCGHCYYKHRQKTGEHACPFNSLYWHFIHRHRDRLASNPRMSMMYRVWEKMNDSDQQALLEQADRYLEQLEKL